MRPGLSIPLALLRVERALLARFLFASLARAALASTWILLVRAFLSGAAGQGGLSGWLTDAYGDRGTIWIAGALLGLVYIATAGLTYDARVTDERLAMLVEVAALDRVMRHLLAMPVRHLEGRTHGDLIETLRRDVANLRAATLAMATLALEATQVLGLVVAAVWLSPRLALWTFLVMPLAAAPVLLAVRPVLVRAVSVRRTSVALFNRILQVVSGIRLVKIYEREALEAERAADYARQHLEALLATERVRAAARVGLDLVGGLGLTAVIVAGGLELTQGRLQWPIFVAFLVAARAAQTPIANVAAAWLEIARHGASVTMLQSLLESPPELCDPPDAKPLVAPIERLDTAQLAMDYGDRAVLQDVTIHVRAGEILGVVGPSGAGKSTLLNLLARLYDPTGGVVRIDGGDVRDIRLADLRRAVALVPQDPFLFAASIDENIRCGRPGASFEEVVAAARSAGIHDEIMTLAGGYGTLVGHGGRALSRGEAQRINIARAFLKDAPILLLDEPTSSLDSEAEGHVQRAVDRLIAGRIAVVVAHRLWTVRDASRILVLAGGRPVAVGTHAVLLEACDVYRRLYDAQR
ncbi:MAG TPA: ABC transporter ATP-binding protein [Vicinamibacterales bacterium]|nr:ABC transporter ATP-binding protein [Vicinamibacterales bacterium]